MVYKVSPFLSGLHSLSEIEEESKKKYENESLNQNIIKKLFIFLFNLKTAEYFKKYKKVHNDEVNKKLFYLFMAKKYDNDNKKITNLIIKSKESYIKFTKNKIIKLLEIERTYLKNDYHSILEDDNFSDLKEIYDENLKLIKLKKSLKENIDLDIFTKLKNYKLVNELSKKLSNEINQKVNEYFEIEKTETDRIIHSVGNLKEKIQILERFINFEKISKTSLLEYKNKLDKLREEMEYLEKIDLKSDIKNLKIYLEDLKYFDFNKEREDIKIKIDEAVKEESLKEFEKLKKSVENFNSKKLNENFNFYKESIEKFKLFKTLDLEYFVNLEKEYKLISKKKEEFNNLIDNLKELENKNDFKIFKKLEENLKTYNFIYEDEIEFKEIIILKLNIFKEKLKKENLKKLDELENDLKTNKFYSKEEFDLYIKKLAFLENKELQEINDIIEKNDLKSKKELELYENIECLSYEELKKLYLNPINFEIYFNEDKIKKIKINNKKEEIKKLMKNLDKGD